MLPNSGSVSMLTPQVVPKKDDLLFRLTSQLTSRSNPLPLSGTPFSVSSSNGLYSPMAAASSVDRSSPALASSEKANCSFNVPSISCVLPSIQLSSSQPVHFIQSVIINPAPSPFTWCASTSSPSDSFTPAAAAVHCTCTKTKCLKLYCNCLKAGRFCTSECDCVNCRNKCDSTERRQVLRKLKSGNAFPSLRSKAKKEGKVCGCTCQRSQCNKKYCSCYQSGRYCTDKCKCVDCSNRSSDAFL